MKWWEGPTTPQEPRVKPRAGFYGLATLIAVSEPMGGLVPPIFDRVPLAKRWREISGMKALQMWFGYGGSFPRAWDLYVCAEYRDRARRRRRRRKVRR